MIPETYKIDFSNKRIDLVQQCLDRLLSQFKDAPVINQIVSVYAKQYQELYDAIIDLQEQRTLYNAKGYYAEVIGRILGRNKQITFADGTNEIANDEFYQELLLFQTFKNSNKFCSIPELSSYFNSVFEFNVSFTRVGIMEQVVSVPVGYFDTIEYQIKLLADSNVVQGAFIAPFPATIVLHYTEYEVLQDTNGSGKRCLIRPRFDGIDDSGWILQIDTTNLFATPIKSFKDSSGSNKYCEIKAFYVGADDFGIDMWNLSLVTTLNNNASDRKFLALNDPNQRCLVQSSCNGIDDSGVDVWVLNLTSIPV